MITLDFYDALLIFSIISTAAIISTLMFMAIAEFAARRQAKQRKDDTPFWEPVDKICDRYER